MIKQKDSWIVGDISTNEKQRGGDMMFVCIWQSVSESDKKRKKIDSQWKEEIVENLVKMHNRSGKERYAGSRE